MRAKSIKVVHYNRQSEEIDIHAEDTRAKIEEAVREVVSRTIRRYDGERLTW